MTRKVVAFLSIGWLVAATLLIPSNSTAQWDDYVVIQPPQPTTADEISIIVGGVWADSCVPQYYYHSIPENTIVIYAVADAPPGYVCAMVITPWEFAVHIGNLPVGSYTIELRIFSLSGWEYPPSFGYFSVVSSEVVSILYLPLITTSEQLSAPRPVAWQRSEPNEAKKAVPQNLLRDLTEGVLMA